MPSTFSSYRLFFCLLLCAGIGSTANAQKNYIKGIVADTAEKRKLSQAIIALIDLSDSTLITAVRTDDGGGFEIEKVVAGKYLLMVSYPRMADFLKEFVITDTSKINTGNIDMVTEAALLQEVIVKAGLPIRMRGDTLEYTADSFAVKPGANVEALLKRLPGIQVEQNGKIIAQGQEVKKILVDGDEFFSDDPGLATKYLNADMVDKVQVFDKKSEQSEFTGIDDGSKTKTINFKLKSSKNNGYFGKVSTGSDLQKYYNHDAMVAAFKGPRKMAVFGLASKIGVAGISAAELTKYTAQDYELIDDGTGSAYYYVSGDNDYGGDRFYGLGLPEVLYGGAHYSNRWRNNQDKLVSNYRTKQIDADGWSNSKSLTSLPGGASFYRQLDHEEKIHSFQQTGGGNVSFNLDSFSVIKVSLNGRFSNGNKNTLDKSNSINEKGFLVSTSNQTGNNIYNNKTWGSNISYQHKFRKTGRTFSLTFQQEYDNGNSNIYNFSANQYFDPASGVFKNTDTLDQLQKSNTLRESYAGKASYTDKLSKKFALFLDYGIKSASSGNSFQTFNKNNKDYSALVDTLSSDYHFLVTTHIAGASVAFNNKKINIKLGGRMFLTGFKQTNQATNSKTDRSFANVAPSFSGNLKLSQNTNLSIDYSGQTNQPSVEQLQPLRRSNNPLYVQIGNPDLKQTFSHRAGLNFNRNNWTKGENFYAYVFATYTDNNITTKTTTDAQNKTVSQFVNLDGIVGINGSISYGKEFKKLHFRTNMSLSGGRSGNYSILNNEKLKSENLFSSLSANFYYSPSDKFSVEYKASVQYNAGKSGIVSAAVSRNWSHDHLVTTKLYLPLKFELGSDINATFQPKNKTFTTSLNIVKWNGYLEKKLLKNEKGFIRFTVNDILNSNTGYTRSVNGNNVYESDRFVIKRYWLLTLGWNFSNSVK